jgi:DNA-directed RNA polymerase subunit omega
MARITIEDCLHKVNNRFSLIHLAAKRVRQLRKGSEPTVVSKNKDIVVALREIAAGNVEISRRAAGTADLEANSDTVLLAEPNEEGREKAADGGGKEA